MSEPQIDKIISSVDGQIVPLEQAVVSVTDTGLLRGDGIFEVVRVYAGKGFELGGHLDRLVGSAERMRQPLDRARIERACNQVLELGGPVGALLRIVVTAGGREFVLLEPLPQHPETLSLATVTYSPSRVLDQIKSLSYAANMLSTRLAKERGADDALWVTPHGRVLENTTSSFFWVQDGKLRTPPLSDFILDSITRRVLVRELEVSEESCTLDQLQHASEAFIASTVREVIAVTTVDELRFKDLNVVARTAQEALSARVAKDLDLASDYPLAGR